MHSNLATADHPHEAYADTGCPRCTLGAPEELPAIGCLHCGTTGAGVYCSKCGEELERKHVVLRALRALFEPFYEYFQYSRWLIHPGELAHEVREGRFTLAELIGFWIAAVLIATMLSGFLTTAEGEKFELPILLEAAQAVLLMLRTALVFAPAHFLLHAGHPEIKIRQYLMATLTVAALIHPWLVTARILLPRWFPGDPVMWTFPLTMTFYATAFAALYRRRVWTTWAVLAAYIVALVALFLGAMSLINGKPVQTVVAPSPRHAR